MRCLLAVKCHQTCWKGCIILFLVVKRVWTKGKRLGFDDLFFFFSSLFSLSSSWIWCHLSQKSNMISCHFIFMSILVFIFKISIYFYFKAFWVLFFLISYLGILFHLIFVFSLFLILLITICFVFIFLILDDYEFCFIIFSCLLFME